MCNDSVAFMQGRVGGIHHSIDTVFYKLTGYRLAELLDNDNDNDNDNIYFR